MYGKPTQIERSVLLDLAAGLDSLFGNLEDPLMVTISPKGGYSIVDLLILVLITGNQSFRSVHQDDQSIQGGSSRQNVNIGLCG